MSDDDRPLQTQAAAPPSIPPTRPIVGTALPDDDFRARIQEMMCKLDENQAALAELNASLKRIMGPPDA